MRILVDTNVWLRSIESNHPQRAEAISGIGALWGGRHEPVIVPQILYEFWVVATRPIDSNGLGLAPERADGEIEAILRSGPILHDDPLMLEQWRQLVGQYQVIGKPAHDARLVAAMIHHRVSHLLTFNAQDFVRYREIVAVTPNDALTLPAENA